MIWGKMENFKGAPIFLFKMPGEVKSKEGGSVFSIGEVTG